ncbi:MAG: hypothetical protein DWQ47_10880 [Acidobacteria bacterium]|nr:MAG: hypothetical protein DWQ32_13295 [Acidobacteriota bacterium]REJ98087.1 MAG: hypothetical protein DWQ38_16095 [Acidobacteriota bacterium]REK16830.1 MAG: hypothetical protein DWQ43_01140 [Acidobacteriota bacterium]REK42741.1 MAG: hypothetical protein DWQ47_10880 [Acidobacteriota bacterium]
MKNIHLGEHTCRLLSVLMTLAILPLSQFPQVIVGDIKGVTRIEDNYPSWSPDGSKLAFHSNRYDGNKEVYTMDADGGNIKRVTFNDRPDEGAIWSPDGKSILYSQYVTDENVDLFITDLESGKTVRLTDHPLPDGHAKFSRDGTKIIFNSQRDDEGKPGLTTFERNYEIYEMNVDGTGIRRLTNYHEWDTYPSYSPDGKKILWRRILDDLTAPRQYNSEIFVMNADGSDLRNLSNSKHFDGYPEWSPDGERIIFASDRHGETPGHLQLFVMNADGSDIQQITWNRIGEEDIRASWSPDGRKIAFNRVNSDGSRVYVMDIAPAKRTAFFSPVTRSVVTEARTSSRGVAWGDYDGNGYPDLLVANTMNNSDLLYRNDETIEFEQIVEGDQVTAGGWTEGVNWIDYDNDGDLDIFFTTQFGRPNELFENSGGGSFSRADAGDLTRLESSSPGACWSDYDLDGDLDVYVIERDGSDDRLFNNRGNKSFAMVKDFPYSGGDGRACAWGDIDNDMYPELYVGNFLNKEKNAKAPNFFYRNRGNGRFSSIRDSIVTSEPNLTYGVSFVDYDQDGDLDLFLTNIARNDRNLLFRNDGAGEFEQTDTLVSQEEGRPSKGHTWGDFDNDGHLDLFIANGTEGVDEKQTVNALYMGDGDGGFVEAGNSAIVTTSNISSGTAWADYDRDGDLDIFVANWGNNTEPNAFYRNDHYGTNWLELSLTGGRSNRYGIGSRVRVKLDEDGASKWFTRWLLPQTGYASQNEPIVHFGLGKTDKVAELEVHWPSGTVTRLSNLSSNQLIEVREIG